MIDGVQLQIVAMLVVAAFAAGWIDSVVGGGGIIQLPSLMIGLPQDTPIATVSGTNKVSSFAGTLAASATYVKRLGVDWRVALPLVVASYAGSSVGAGLVQYVPRQWFNPVLLVAVVAIGWYTYTKPDLGQTHAPKHTGMAQAARAVPIGLGVGLWDGVVGPGTGTIFVICLVALLGFAFLHATVLAKLANLTTNLAAIIVLGFSGHILWGVGLMMAAANMTGGLIGSRMAISKGNGFIRKVFLVAAVVLGTRIAYDTVVGLLPK